MAAGARGSADQRREEWLRNLSISVGWGFTNISNYHTKYYWLQDSPAMCTCWIQPPRPVGVKAPIKVAGMTCCINQVHVLCQFLPLVYREESVNAW